MIGIFVEDMQNKLIALIMKLYKVIVSPVMSPRLTLDNIEDKNIDKLMSIELFNYNITKHVDGIKNISYIDRYRIHYTYRELYHSVYTTLNETKYDTVKYNILYNICVDIIGVLDTIKKYKSYNGITPENLQKSLDTFKSRYNKVKFNNDNNDKKFKDLFSIIPYMKLDTNVKEIALSIRTTNEILDNTISNSLAEQTVALLKLYKDYEDTESRAEIERQLLLISEFLKEQIELNALPGSKKYVNNKLGISSHYIQSVIDNNNWVE